MKSLALAFGAMTFGLFATTWTHDARACGGCFHGEAPTTTQSPSVVTDHRMVLAITPTMTTLWDQVEYAGDPEDFAWVLPIRGGVVVSVGSDSFIDGLDQQTAPVVRAPAQVCAPRSFGGGGGGGGGGCGMGSADEESAPPSMVEDAGVGWQEDSGVFVTNRSVVGPYQTVQVHGSDAGGIVGWLRQNGYVVPDDLVPMLQKYVTEGYDFVAVRLRPSFGVRAMRPIRVSFKGAYPTLPLRMVRAGIGNQVGLKLFVIGDGRWKAANFPALAIDPSMLTWDFAIQRSDYVAIRDREAAKLDYRAFVMEASTNVAWTALPAPPYEPPAEPEDTGTPALPDSGKADGVADSALDGASDEVAIADATSADVATDAPDDAANPASDASDAAVVEDTAKPTYDGGAPPSVSPNATDVELAYGNKSVRRVTRLRGDIPAKFLDVELVLEADLAQSELQPLVPVTKAVNDPCASTVAADDASESSGGSCYCVVSEPNQPLRAGLGLFGAAMAAALLRRRKR